MVIMVYTLYTELQSTSYMLRTICLPLINSYIHDGSSNHRTDMLLDYNCSYNRKDSMVLNQNSLDNGYSVRVNNGLREVVEDFLGNYGMLECKPQPPEKEQKNKISSQAAYLGLDEFRNKTMQEKGRDVPSQHGNITHKLEPGGSEYNYASSAKGAKVLAHNKEAKGASDILGRDKDKYLRNPCSADVKFVIIELSEETLVDSVQIANLEHYSSNFKDFELLGSLTYPTEIWTSLGNFIAENVRHAQRFMLPEPKWVRYLRLDLITHYGSEFYCTLSFLEVYGVDAIERMLEDLIVVSDELPGDQSTNSNPVGFLSPRSEAVFDDKKDVVVQANAGVDPPLKGIDNGDIQKLDTPNSKNEVLVTNPIKEVRQQSNGRIPSDTVLKILMQKVRSLELNLSVLEGYVKEMNRRYSNVLPDLEKDISQNALLLEKTISEIKDIDEWKEVVEKRFSDLLSWKLNVSSQIEALVRENVFLRLGIEKVLSDRATMENKELAVLAVSFSFACVAFLKLVVDQIMMLFRTCEPEKSGWTSKGWLLILVSSSMTTFIALLYN
ncbi:SUN domain-containing protein 5-like isoform X2 [Magnolia sinica]|uniref:SUN domain-containing protein 5-like isoform X2 n=1 Tax=Magnolia sinica TaxID=86752 RepID=UPI002658CCA7|nr:SUN domain-containing protein 5-like isoform X2 [Magnolia sinica]